MGISVGKSVGGTDGGPEGTEDGAPEDGKPDGANDGTPEGTNDGASEDGKPDGTNDGRPDGRDDGAPEDGKPEGANDGGPEGADDGGLEGGIVIQVLKRKKTIGYSCCCFGFLKDGFPHYEKAQNPLHRHHRSHDDGEAFVRISTVGYGRFKLARKAFSPLSLKNA